MKTVIYYFSATGNSLVVARTLADKLGNATCVAIPHAIGSTVPDDARRVGLVFPVYAWGTPLLIKDFIDKLNVTHKAYWFVVATCGSSIGRTFTQTQKLLARHSVSLNAGWQVFMPGNCTTLYDVSPPEKQQRKFVQAQRDIDLIADDIRNNRSVEPPRGSPWLNWLLSGIIYRLFSVHVHKCDRNFWSTDDCTSCGLCVKVCPADNIKLENRRPTWLGRCEQCLACLHWCPVRAIQYKKKTLDRSQYHHPDVSAADIM